MGLAEKRQLAKVRDEIVPQYQKEISEIVGSKIAYDIDWDSFADNLDAMENLEPKALKPMNEMFRKITIDKIGKDAVKQSIQTIRLSQGSEANISNFTLQEGVLNLPWDWVGWGGSFYLDSVQEKLESML